MADPTEARRRKRTPTGKPAAAALGGAAYVRARELGIPAPGTTTERIFDDDEWEFCRAVTDFRERTGTLFPTLSQYLFILKGLGYRKPPPAVDPAPTPNHD